MEDAPQPLIPPFCSPVYDEPLQELISRVYLAFSCAGLFLWPCQQLTTPSERALILLPCYMHNHNQRPSYTLMSKKVPEPPAQQKDLLRQENTQLRALALRSWQPDTMAKVQICWVMGFLKAGCWQCTCVSCHSAPTRHNHPSVAVQASPFLLHNQFGALTRKVTGHDSIALPHSSEPWQRVDSQ